MSVDEHVLLPELSEQPNPVPETIDADGHEIDQIARLPKNRRIHFLGMGSSHFASHYATYLMSELTHNAAAKLLASEFVRYPSAIGVSEVGLAVCRSGESIETVKAIEPRPVQVHSESQDPKVAG